MCGHYVGFKNDGCPIKQADAILANPNSSLADLVLIRCTRYKEFVRHPTVFMLQIVDPEMYQRKAQRPDGYSEAFQARIIYKNKAWILKWRRQRRRFKAIQTTFSVFDGIVKKMKSLSSRSSLPEFKWRKKMYKVRRMSIGNIRKYCRRVNRFNQTFALRLLKDKYGRSRL